METLKKAVQHKVEEHSLNQDQLASLMAMQDTNIKPSTTPAWRSATTRGWAVAACLLIISITLFLRTPDNPHDKVQAIALEVVKNHLHQKPLEIQSPQLAEVSSYFQRLDFRPIDSQYLHAERLSLMGGRYCSLQGVPAAQLRYREAKSNSQHTLYQVGYQKDIFASIPDIDQGAAPIITYANGIRVTLWVENGILFALTDD